MDNLRRELQKEMSETSKLRQNMSSMLDERGNLLPLIGDVPIEIRRLHGKFEELREKLAELEHEKKEAIHSAEISNRQAEHSAKAVSNLKKQEADVRLQSLQESRSLTEQLKIVETESEYSRDAVNRSKEAERHSKRQIDHLQKIQNDMTKFVIEMKGKNRISQELQQLVDQNEGVNHMASLMEASFAEIRKHTEVESETRSASRTPSMTTKLPNRHVRRCLQRSKNWMRKSKGLSKKGMR
jgi:chromosome segregation ATPase